jgi:hypothetical protein
MDLALAALVLSLSSKPAANTLEVLPSFATHLHTWLATHRVRVIHLEFSDLILSLAFMY